MVYIIPKAHALCPLHSVPRKWPSLLRTTIDLKPFSAAAKTDNRQVSDVEAEVIDFDKRKTFALISFFGEY